MHRVALNLHKLTTVIYGTPDRTPSAFLSEIRKRKKKKKKELLWWSCLPRIISGMKITEII